MVFDSMGISEDACPFMNLPMNHTRYMLEGIVLPVLLLFASQTAMWESHTLFTYIALPIHYQMGLCSFTYVE